MYEEDNKNIKTKDKEKWATIKWVFTAIPLLLLSYVIGYAVIWIMWKNVYVSSIAGWIICYIIYKKYGTVRQ
jgi:hypothetical protein